MSLNRKMKVKLKDPELLKSAAGQKGLTLNALSVRIGVSNPVVYNIYNQKRTPSLILAVVIANFLEVNWDDMFEIVEGGVAQ